MCSESGLPDDLSWGRLGYIRWLDTAQDLCHSKATHPLDHTDFTVGERRRPTATFTAGPKVDGLVGIAEEAARGGESLRREWAGTSSGGGGRRRGLRPPAGARATGGGGSHRRCHRRWRRPAAAASACGWAGGYRRGWGSAAEVRARRRCDSSRQGQRAGEGHVFQSNHVVEHIRSYPTYYPCFLTNLHRRHQLALGPRHPPDLQDCHSPAPRL